MHTPKNVIKRLLVITLGVFAITLLLSTKGDQLYASPQSELKKLTTKVNQYIRDSRKTRSMNRNRLNKLIRMICKLDIERSGDGPTKMALQITKGMQRMVKSKYNQLITRNRRLRTQVDKLRKHKSLNAKVKQLLNRLRIDSRSLYNVNRGVFMGPNNPMVRAKLKFGQTMHNKLKRDSKYNCYKKKEWKLGNGRADCVDIKNCIVWEFKPRGGKGQGQANRYANYINGHRTFIKVAPHCFKNGKGKFKGKVKDYTPCR